ncbi:putative enzyme related to lactoylglutathione lyase [Neorhizobium galegae]|uniref:VOC family protein n=1 Tax=Rhizobium/Agrobacterium group TaxID=227290 RepID=UPI001AE6B637|nr:VOC family protein [Neorhizobium galegae]MBP2547608.1 putative enzyme related to lactoylglutathione lyase [Neorhizobium galegae]
MPSETHGKFIWCELMTSDTDAAARFYQAITGWTVGSMPMPAAADGMPGMTYHIFNTQAGSQTCGVAGMMDIPEAMKGQLPPNWTGYVAVDDVDGMARDFAQAGGAIMRPPEDIPGVGRFSVVADPHGAVLCLMTPAPMDTPPPEPEPGTPGTFGWHELMAGDGEEAFAFYSKMFGWTLDHAIDMGAMGRYLIFAHQGQAIGGMMTRPPHVPVACWSYYINVPAMAPAVAAITEGGGQVVNGPMPVPGGSVIVNAQDPQGAYFSLVASAA